MDYNLPSGDSDVRLRFVMQIVEDACPKSDQVSMSVVSKPTNTIASIVSRIQLFEGTMTNSFKQPYLTRTKKDCDCGKVRRIWV